MTVTVRPVPQRVARNGIRPFRPVVPTNNLGPVTVKNWRPPVPEPLPPAPLIGPRGLLALGALVLAQIWGALNSRPAREVVEYPGGVPVSGSVPPAGATVGADLRILRAAGRPRAYIDGSCQSTQLLPSSPGHRQTIGNVVDWAIDLVQSPGGCGFNLRIRTTSPGGAVGYSVFIYYDYDGFSDFGGGVEFEWLSPDAVPYVPPVVPIPLPEPYQPPAPKIAPDVMPQPQPAPPQPLRPVAPPAPSPGGPSPLPGAPPVIVPVTPGPAAPPVPAPSTPPAPAPAAVPGASPLPNGVVPPAPTAVVPTTPPDAHFPVPGAPPVTGNGPRPTPEGIAQELGRLEQKVARLSNPQTDATGDATDRIGLALKLLGDLIEFFTSITAGGGYELSSPCEVDEAGQPIPVVVDFSSAPSALGVINNKIDAVAQLLQEHKNLKQPICRQTPAVGEPVTVQFVQVD